MKKFETLEDLTWHIIKNYSEITGLPEEAMNEEGHFPQEIEAMVIDNGFDFFDFNETWSNILG